MRLATTQHLAYCTNIHRGEDWEETLNNLDKYTLAVRERVCSQDEWYAIGLRLSAQAAFQLSDGKELLNFQKWLEKNRCYVFTINGFPYGNFHGSRVKEKVYVPDWTTHERLEYTKTLFDILVELLPSGLSGSVSTVPGSFKSFIRRSEQEEAIYRQISTCAQYIDKISKGSDLHLGLEPEPLGWIETVDETKQFFERLRQQLPEELWFRVGVNYDTCHMAIEYEDANQAIETLHNEQIRLSKIHLSSALKLRPNQESIAHLQNFLDEVYLHQVIARDNEGGLTRYFDLDEALLLSPEEYSNHEEWRIHFHIPLHTPDHPILKNTSDHLLKVIYLLKENVSLCSHLEFETYTWEVLPQEMKSADVVEQLVAEYQWCLEKLKL
ncbi:MAG: metabolite traffic protein EboE [Verrucomicrobiota bacterium]